MRLNELYDYLEKMIIRNGDVYKIHTIEIRSGVLEGVLRKYYKVKWDAYTKIYQKYLVDKHHQLKEAEDDIIRRQKDALEHKKHLEVLKYQKEKALKKE
jgi:hypothetical protein